MMLMPGSFYSAAIVLLSWVTGTLSQPSIKRASAIAMINAVCNTPNGRSTVFPMLAALTHNGVDSVGILPLLFLATIPCGLLGQSCRFRLGYPLSHYNTILLAATEPQSRAWLRCGTEWPNTCPDCSRIPLCCLGVLVRVGSSYGVEMSDKC